MIKVGEIPILPNYRTSLLIFSQNEMLMLCIDL